MDPEKRATCKEVVERFLEIYGKAQTDEDYCLQSVPGLPKRVNTDLSTLVPHLFDPNDCGGSNSQSSHDDPKEGESMPSSISGVMGARTAADEDEFQSTSRTEEATSRLHTLEVPRDSRGNGPLDCSSTTNRSSSRGSKHAGSDISGVTEGKRARNAKRHGFREKFRSFLCW